VGKHEGKRSRHRLEGSIKISLEEMVGVGGRTELIVHRIGTSGGVM